MTAALHRASQTPAAHSGRSPRAPGEAPRWELVRPIGQGRWARVYAARRAAESEPKAAADYAIKVPCQSRAALAMLRREATIGTSVSHQSLAPVLEWQLRGEPYLVMPRIDGLTLRQIVARRRHEFGCLIGASKFLLQSVWTIRQTAAALAALHHSGWLHGDVKPDNVLVSPQGHATLLDLGLARRLGSRECLAGDILAGTFGYLSPESFLSGEMHTEASDIYSLGAVLYELLAGQPIFTETDPDRLALLHLRQSPLDVREAALDVPPPLAQLVMRMLAKEPLRRPTAEEVGRELTRVEISLLGSR